MCVALVHNVIKVFLKEQPLGYLLTNKCLDFLLLVSINFDSIFGHAHLTQNSRISHFYLHWEGDYLWLMNFTLDLDWSWIDNWLGHCVVLLDKTLNEEKYVFALIYTT